MEDSVLSKELIKAFRPIAEMNNARFRQVKTMLAGFIALQERDLNYMDEYMDTLFDFMDPMSDEAKERLNSLENDMGYMTKIVYAAGLVAQKLHNGQTDKGGNDYFESHLLKVASSGYDWKEKVVGFLHDASEDYNVTVEDVMNLLDKEISRLLNNPIENWWEEDWWEDWMEDIDKYPCETTHVITNEERDEIKTALTLLNHHTASSREEYINRISRNFLALKIKLQDLESNIDISRIQKPTEKDYARIERYKKEYHILMEALRNRLNI